MTAFLPLNLVTYTWSVVPTTVQDVYDIQVTTTFQTNVPAPVVTVDPMYVDLSQLTLRFHRESRGQLHRDQPWLDRGAELATLTLPASVGGYTVTPLFSALGTSPPSPRWWCRW